MLICYYAADAAATDDDAAFASMPLRRHADYAISLLS